MASMSRSVRGRELSCPEEEDTTPKCTRMYVNPKKKVNNSDIDKSFINALKTSHENYNRLRDRYKETCKLLDEYRDTNTTHDEVQCSLEKKDLEKKLELTTVDLGIAESKLTEANLKLEEVRGKLGLKPEADQQAILDRIQEFRRGREIDRKNADKYEALFNDVMSEKNEVEQEVIDLRNRCEMLELIVEQEVQKAYLDIIDPEYSATSPIAMPPTNWIPAIRATERCIFCRTKYPSKESSGCYTHPSRYVRDRYDCCSGGSNTSGCLAVPHVRVVLTPDGKYLTDEENFMKLKNV